MFGKQWFQGAPGGAGTIGELLAVLDRVEQLCIAAGAKAPAKDLRTFSDVLKPHADKSVASFCADTRDRLNQSFEKAQGRKNRTAAGKNAPANEAISHHVAALRSAGTERHAFDAAFERLKADKSLRSSAVAEIARQYALTVTKYKSIAAAHTDIEKAFVRQARFENKLR